MSDTNHRAFLELVRAGLWEKNARLSIYGNVDYSEIYRFAVEQSVVGLVAAGFEHVEDVRVRKEILLQFVGQALQIEQRNQAMNKFVADLVEKLRKEDVYTLLLKGQGVAQCYIRPLWRACGDIDLFLSEENFNKAKSFLIPFANNVGEEYRYTEHLGMDINSWEVELHGNLRSELTRRIDRELDLVKDDVFYSCNVRPWQNGQTIVFLLGVDNDVVYVFTHILQHFFKKGIGLRQICDWCRLLWFYRDSIKYDLLEKRIRAMGLMSEWKTFAALAVCWLGMPERAMPLYSDNICWQRKAQRVLSDILINGNMGNNTNDSYRDKGFLFRKIISVWRSVSKGCSHFLIFPQNSIIVLCRTLKTGMLSTLNFNR